MGWLNGSGETPKPIGGLWHVSYADASVVTDHIRLFEQGGVPQGSFLLAVASWEGAPVKGAPILLLRVDEIGMPPGTGGLVEMRAEAAGRFVPYPNVVPDENLDPWTRVELQRVGLMCAVLGQFWWDENRLRYGNLGDVPFPPSSYRVYVPDDSDLERICDTAPGVESGRKAKVGTLRYSETRHHDNVHVLIDPEDLVGRSTAMFGQTRSGKSNAVKVLVTKMQVWARRNNRKIGTLIVDRAGEYVSRSHDEVALPELGEDVVVFSYGTRDGQLPEGYRRLAINFYADDALDIAWVMTRGALSGPQYGNAAAAADVRLPDAGDDPDTARVLSKRVFLVRALFIRAGMDTPALPNGRWRLWVSIRKELVDEIRGRLGLPENEPFRDQNHHTWGWLPEHAVRAAEFIADNPGVPGTQSWYEDPDCKALLGLFGAQVNARHANNRVRELRTFHATDAAGDYRVAVRDELVAGKIVIVDASTGTDTETRFLVDGLVTHIIQAARDDYRAHLPKNEITLVLDEAHYLFSEKRLQDENDPYAILAKEAAKYGIGMIYATQEPSSVDDHVLVNTRNWVVAHLSSSKEIRRLPDAYGFPKFERRILAGDVPGLVLIKTQKARYPIPAKFELYDVTLVKEARDAITRAGERNKRV